MKTFNKVEDQKLNGLAIAFANGDQDAGNDFMEIVMPKLKGFAGKKYSELEKEDLLSEFYVEAVEACYEYADRYQETGQNVMGLIFTKCKQKHIDLGRKDGAEKRSKKIVVGEETIAREVSFQAPLGDQDNTLLDKIANEDKSLETQVFDKLNESSVESIVKQFSANTKGRNGKIIPVILQAYKEGWENSELDASIENILMEEGASHTPASVRQAKTRALKKIRTDLIEGKVASLDVEWDFPDVQ